MIDPLALRGALGSFATGVTIVTTKHAGRNIGLTANSFNSVSLDPPLVLWSLAKKSANLDAFMDGDAFAVHILSADQEALSNRFATPGIDKFDGLEVATGNRDIPLLQDCAARFECQTAYRYDGGDHVIFVGEVLELDHSDQEPLLFHQGKYAQKAGSRQTAGEENPRDLNYLIARSYFRLTDEVRLESQKLGITQVDHYALSALMKNGPSTLEMVNSILSGSGEVWSEQCLNRLISKEFVTKGAGDLIELTKTGREAMIGLFALAKAAQVQAQDSFEDAELDQLRSLLSQLLDSLGDGPHAGGAHHLEVMNALQADQG